jgi:hypothetical protein
MATGANRNARTYEEKDSYRWDETDRECWTCGPIVETETSYCSCTVTEAIGLEWRGSGWHPSTAGAQPDETREVCTQWHCTEQGGHEGHSAVEEEDYFTHVRDDLGTVSSWSGRTDSVEEFERSGARVARV